VQLSERRVHRTSARKIEEKEDRDEESEIAPCGPKDYSKGDVCLVRPAPDSKHPFWVAEVQEDYKEGEDKMVKVWWMQSRVGNDEADNPEAGIWRLSYKPQASKKRKAPEPYIDHVWPQTLDMLVEFSGTGRISIDCLKHIHTRVADWKIGQVEQEAAEIQLPDTSPNPGYVVATDTFLRPPPATFSVPVDEQVLSVCKPDTYCIACAHLVWVSNQCSKCKIPFCQTHYRAHIYWVHTS
jgi:hypothetical protein